MKNVAAFMILLAFMGGCATLGISAKDPKKMACEESCKSARDDCKQKSDSDVKKMACDESFSECKKKCN